MLYKKSIFLTAFLLNIATASAGDMIAFLKFSNEAGWKQLNYQMSVASKSLCYALNESYWQGVKNSCPNCAKLESGCLSTLPSEYIGMINNSPIALPYVTSGDDRAVFSGMPIVDAIHLCQSIANETQKQMNEAASCIIPQL